MTTRVLLVDDHALFRKGLAQLINSNRDLEVVGETADGSAAIEMALLLEPDIILIDLNMKSMSGIATLRGLKEAEVTARCIMLTVSDDERDVLDAMRAGADGYLLKDLEPEDLCDRLKQAAGGAVLLDSGIAKLLTHALSTPAPAQAASMESVDLTDREQEILSHLANGRNNKEIGRLLGISDATVKVHIKHLLRKLNLKSRLEAAVWTLQRRSPRPS